MTILGKGIDAIEVSSNLIEHNSYIPNILEHISLQKIIVGKYQPRKKEKVKKESLPDLIASIMENGILQPIIVRKVDNDEYEIIAGERRYLAAIEANLRVIPCIIKDVTEKQAFAIALIENIQREQLNLLEVSECLLKLKDEHNLSIDEVSKLIGKPRTTVANLVRVAALTSQEGKLLWEEGLVNFGHIRAAIVLDRKFQNIVLKYVAEKKLSVRETERLIKDERYFYLADDCKEKEPKKHVISDDDINIITNKFSTIYSRKVKIKPFASGKIRVYIEFENLETTYDYLTEKYNNH